MRLTFKVCVKTTMELPPEWGAATLETDPGHPYFATIIPTPPQHQYIIYFDVSDYPPLAFGEVVKAGLTLMTCDPERAAMFERGKAYHIDFTPAD